MASRRVTLCGGLLAIAIAVVSPAAIDPLSAGASAPPASDVSYQLTEVAPGVHVAIAQGVPDHVANSVVIVGDGQVLLVDSGAGPGEAEVLRAAIRTLTGLPVRYVVDTHFHYDHALGHAAFPDAATIGHVETRAGLALGLRQPTLSDAVDAMPARVSDLRTKAAAAADPKERAALLADAGRWDAYRQELAGLVPSPTRITFTAELTLWLGRREVRLLHLGRGHTAGDLVVHLPAERVVCTGDLFNGYIGYMGDAYVDEWAATLDRLAQMDFQTVIPGHGKPFAGKEAIPAVQACLRDLWNRRSASRRRAFRPGRRPAASTCAPTPPGSRSSPRSASISWRSIGFTR